MESYKIEIINDDYSITKLTLPGATLGTKAEYPSDWFKENIAKKPSVTVPKEIKEKDVWARMLGYALHSTVSRNVAVRFLFEFSNNFFEEQLTKDWTSYRRTIGAENDAVTPSRILDVTESESDWNAPEGDEASEEDELRLFCILLAGYRYGMASEVQQGDYKAAVLGKINQVLRNEPYDLDSDLTPTELIRCKTWYNNLEFRVLIAALDMFWSKFPDSYGAKLRVCTLNARFKDCSSISEINHLQVMSGKKIDEIFKYIFCSRVRDEIINIGRTGEEIDKEDSYFPYMREMRISKKSPYSSTENVHLHNWISMFCALLGSERSFNARIVSESGLLNCMNLAIFSAYSFRKFASAKIDFDGKRDAEAAKILDEMDELNSEGGSSEIDPASALGVYQNIIAHKGIVPQEMFDIFSRTIGNMGTPRNKTIGLFLKRNLTN